MLIIEMAKIELIGGHIGSKLIIEMAKIEINRRPYCHYANYRDGLNKFTGGQIGIMLILEMAKIEFTGGYIGFIVFI